MEKNKDMDLDIYFGVKALFIDDVENIRYSTAMLVKKHGIDMLTLADPVLVDSLSREELDSIDVILSDGEGIIDRTINMRDMYLPGREIVVYSGNCSLVKNYELLGYKGLVKPVKPLLLAEVLYEQARNK